MLRPLLRRLCYTPNTIRYRVEWPRLEEAFRQIGPVQTLFDGGAGSGEFSRRALEAGFCQKSIALEYDDGNYALLEKNLGREKGVKTIHGSLLDVPLPDSCADIVLCTQVLEHLEEHEKAASELVRVLKPGGHAIITVPHPPEPFPNDGHVREGYTEDDLKALFEPLGMTALHTSYFLTKGTLAWMVKAGRMPAGGVFLPVAFVDRERHLQPSERQAQDPFGILVLFRKNA